MFARFGLGANLGRMGSARQAVQIPSPLLRASLVGHSLVSVAMGPLFAQMVNPLSTIKWQVIVGAGLQWQWDNAAEASGTNVRADLENGETDQLLLTEAGPIEDHIQFSNTVGLLGQWHDLAKLHNPSVKVIWYEIWPEIDPEDTDFSEWAAEVAALADSAYAAVLDEFRLDRYPDDIIYLSPVGSALAALLAAVDSEDITDLGDFGDLFIDSIHLSEIGLYFACLVHYATMTGESPVGLPWDIGVDGLTEGMAADLQALVWEHVSNHPYAGVAEYPDPTVPAAFVEGDWSLTPGNELLTVAISSLPDNGGAPITDVEYRVDGGSWVSSGGVSSFNITGLTNDVEYDIELRAVNVIGESDASDLKASTPSGATWHPSVLFGSGEQGVIYDVTSEGLSSIYPAINGEGANVSANDDPLGFVSDQSGNDNHWAAIADWARGVWKSADGGFVPQTAGGVFGANFVGFASQSDLTFAVRLRAQGSVGSVVRNFGGSGASGPIWNSAGGSSLYENFGTPTTEVNGSSFTGNRQDLHGLLIAGFCTVLIEGGAWGSGHDGVEFPSFGDCDIKRCVAIDRPLTGGEKANLIAWMGAA